MFLKNMKLRSREIVIIDFDEASKAWRKNKIDIGNGCYKYKKNTFKKNTFKKNTFKKNNNNTKHPISSRHTRSNPINFIYS
jgi:hypothetical protein